MKRSDTTRKEVINLVRKYTGKNLVDARMADEMVDLIVAKIDREIMGKLDRIYVHLKKQGASDKILKLVSNMAVHLKSAENRV